LPLYSESSRVESKKELDLAAGFAIGLTKDHIPQLRTKKITAIRDHFHVRDVSNAVTELIESEDLLKLEKEETVAAAFVKKIFSKSGDHYTCFYVGGNSATLDIGTWDVAYLLNTIIKESKRKNKR
jgi:hypothetical protein